MIVLLAGLPGAGKSALARELSVALKAIVLDKDVIRAAIFPPSQIEYSTRQDDFCMGIILQAAGYILRENPEQLVLLDGRPFSRRYQIEQVIEFAEQLNQTWRIIECRCSDETARSRLEADSKSNQHLAGNRGYRLYLSVKSAFEQITFPKTIIDTDQPLEICMQQAISALRE